MYDYDVVISGYGPTGQAAASLLARLGHSVCVFERWPSMYGLPRLCSIDGESCRIVQAGGDVDSALAESTEVHHYRLVDAQGETLLDVDWENTRVCGFYDRISMYQPDVERALDTAARERGAEINQGWEVTGAVQDADGVTVSATRSRRAYEGAGSEPPREVRAKFVIGADGARSAIRTSVAAEREDLGFREGFLSVDVNRKRTFDLPPDTAVTICDPDRNVSVIPIGPNRMRFEFLVNPDDDNTELLTPDVGYHFLKTAWNLTPDDVEIYRQVIYPFEAKIAEQWRHGRILLAGDAAHLMPPFAGQGACSGLRDSMNLSWKLDLILRGVAPFDLLDTYTVERRPQVRQITAWAIQVGEIACTRDHEIAAQRDAMLRSGAAPPPSIDAPKVQNGVLYRGDDGTLAPAAGELVPQGTVQFEGSTGRFDDLVGWGFMLLARDSDPLGLLDSEQRSALGELRCQGLSIGSDPGSAAAVVDVGGEYAPFFAAHGVEAILVRPDFTVFGGVATLDELPAMVDDLLEQLGVHAHSGATV
jgi:3-(3-hydroxy-phenyl)propionate hydroxylase